MSVARYALALVALASAPAWAQVDPPVIFVHGLNSCEMTWKPTVEALEDGGWGPAYTFHADLNATYSTDWRDDVLVAAAVPYGDFDRSADCSAERSARRRGVSATQVRSARVRSDVGGSRLFLVNFEATSDLETMTVYPGEDWSDYDVEPDHSDSNESAVAKQAAALAIVVGDVLALTGSDRVVLVGHSLGGLAIREYLQRRHPDGTPRWWTDPSTEGGHAVAAVVTYGTPHQGSAATTGGLVKAFLGVDIDSEAVRDLRQHYPSSCWGGGGPGCQTGHFLFGGPEYDPDSWGSYWHNYDVNADGDEDDVVVGLNAGDPSEPFSPDNPAMPLPSDVAYTYIYSLSSFTGTGDGVVSGPRQLVQFLGVDGTPYVSPVGSARAVRRDVHHRSQPGDYEMIVWAVENALWFSNPTDADPAPIAAETVEVSVGPNPAPGRTTLSVRLTQPATVTVSVVDVLGRTVVRQNLGAHPAGETRVPLELGDLTPGLYLVRTVVGERPAPAVPVTVVR